MPFSATRDLWLVLKARDEATGAMRAFSRDIRMVGDSVKEANLRAARSALQNEMATKRLSSAYQIGILRQGQQTAATQGAIKAIEADTRASLLTSQKRINSIDKEISAMHNQRAAMEENRVSSQRLSATFGGLSRATAALGTITVAASAIGVAGLHNLIKTATDYEKQSSLTRTQVDKFASSLQDIEKIGLEVANKIGVPFEQIQPALFDIFSSMEVGAKDAQKLLEIFARAAVAGQTDIQNASKATIGILNAFQLPISAVNHLMDVQFQLVKEGIGTYDEWSQRIGLVTPSAVRFGQSVDMMAAALAASTRMGISAARSATSVSRAMDAMSNPIAVKNLKALGIAAYDSSGKFRPMIDILTDFRTKLEKIPNKDRIKAILDVFKGAGGTIEARRFLQNMLLTPGNLELFRNILNGMSKSSGSFEQAYSIMADTTATKSELLANKWQEVKIAAGQALIPTFLKVISFAGKLFDKFNALSPATKAWIVRIVAAGAVLTGLLGILLLIVSGVLAMAAALAVAGTGVLTFIGIFAGVGVAIGAVMTALAILTIKSKGFRDIISDTGGRIRDFWQNDLIPMAKAVKSAWDKYMAPAFNGLSSVIENKVMPMIRELQAFMNSKMLDAIKLTASIIAKVLVSAFKILGGIIKSWIIPLINRLTKFYDDHKETILQIVGVIITIVKYLMVAAAAFVIVGTVVAGVFLAAIALAIGALILVGYAIVKVVDGAKWLVKWIGTNVPKAWDWLVAKTKSIWNAIASFFVGLWHGIVDFFKSAWQAIVDVFTSFMDFVAKRWSAFWNSDIGGLVKAVIYFISSILQLGFYSILYVVETSLKNVHDVFFFIWDGIKAITTAVWDFIFPYLKGTWENISGAAIIVWDLISGIISRVWNQIKEAAILIWTLVTSFVIGKWNALKSIASTVWQFISDTIGSKLSDAWTKVQNFVSKVKDFFSTLGHILYDAGKAIIQGLIDGMTAMFNKLGDAASRAAKAIKDHLPFSPAKKGPLSGRGNPYYSGQSIVRQLSAGMLSQMSKLALTNAATMVAATSMNMNGGMNSSPVNTNSDTGGSTYNQNFTINTHEINPRRHAAELGWLLVGGSR